MISEMRAPSRLSYGRIPNLVELKDLIATQLESFKWFKSEGLRELFDEINPITDYTGKNFELKFLDYEFGQPKFSVEECRNRDMTYAAPLRIRTRLTIKETGEIKESEVYMGDFAMMTDEGTFIVNGTERVVVSQLVRSPGVYFTAAEDPNTGRKLFGAKLIPNRGAWLEIETSAKDLLTVKIDRKRKVPVTVLLKALELPQLKGTENDREAQKRALHELFGDVDNNPEHRYMESTADKDTTSKTEDALLELYRRVRPGDPPSVDNARNLLQSLFFNPRRFDLGRVGRYKVDKRLGRDEEDILERVRQRELRILEKGDFIAFIRKLIELNNAPREKQIPDDIDHLGNRRVRAVGELLQNQFRMGLIRMERIIKERMTISDPHTVTSASLINARPVVAAIKEFFGSSQLSQFMDQHNPLSELTHKRRLSALGPGGLSRERAGFDVRDVHHSHYGRICPIETPEGPNIGLIGNLATYAKVNEFGFIETPFRRVYNRVSLNEDVAPKLEGRTLRRAAVDPKGTEVLPAHEVLDAKAVQKLLKAKVASIEYFMADPSAYWGVSKDRGRVALAARPNAGHHALAALEASGNLVAIVTQNTDGLHRDAGSRNVIELHGSSRTVSCLDCGNRETRSEVQARLEIEMPPRCKVCHGGFLKPTVVLFGEPLPKAAIQQALTLARQADVMLVVGTSLVVYPAADIPAVALRSGAQLIVINAEPTPFDELAAVVVRGKSGEVLPEILALIDG